MKNEFLWVTGIYILNVSSAVYQVHLQNYVYATISIMVALWALVMVIVLKQTTIFNTALLQEQSLQRVIELLEQIREGTKK